MVRGIVLAALLGLLNGGPFSGQTPVPPAANQPGAYSLSQTIRTVVLDVAVVDRSGRPVSGLTEDDFHIQEDGQPQEINFFQTQADHALPLQAQSLTGHPLLKKSGDAPLTILLLDELSTGPEDLAYAREQVRHFLERQPEHLRSPTTLLALTGTSLKQLNDFTTDRTQLIAAVRADKEPPSWYALRNHQVGFKSTNLQTAPERLGTYLGALREFAAELEPYRTRKNLLWVGPGLPALNQTLALTGSQRQLVRTAINSVVSDLVRTRITLYTIDPQGLMVTPTQIANLADNVSDLTTSGGDPSEGELAFEQLAPATGGEVFRMRNDVAQELTESVVDGSAYYTLGYTPKNKVYDGKFRQISVVLTNPAYRARTRQGYLATAETPNHANVVASAITFAVTSGLHYGGIATSARLGGVPDAETVHVAVGAADLQWTPDAASGLEEATLVIAVANLGRDGKAGDYTLQTMHARAAEPAIRTGVAEFVLPFRPAKGSRMRVVVRDALSGHIGSADIPPAGES